MDLKNLEEMWNPMSSNTEYSKWLSTLPDMEKSSENKSQLCTLQEGLLLDLQVMSADLFGLQGSLSGIARRLQELEALVQARYSPIQEFQ